MGPLFYLGTSSGENFDSQVLLHNRKTKPKEEKS